MERARLKITQEELARRIGVTRFAILSLENGKYKVVKPEVLEKLAAVFQIDVEDLLEKKESIFCN